MDLLIDTNVFAHVQKGTYSVDFSKYDKYGNAYICDLIQAELLTGVYAADTAQKFLERAPFVFEILTKIPSLPYNEEVILWHAYIKALYVKEQKRLRPLGQSLKKVQGDDMIIAATACYYHLSILTDNYDHFSWIPPLLPPGRLHVIDLRAP